MRILLSIVFIGAAFFAQAQGTDDYYPDARKKNENFSKLRDKDIRAHIATFALAGIDERMGKEPLRVSVPPTGYGSDYISFEGHNVKVIIKSKPFEAAKHKLTYYNEKFLVKIDNKPYYGHYTQVPANSIAGVTVLVGGDTVEIPAAAYQDLHTPVFAYRDGGGTVRTHNRVYLSPDGRNIYIYMLNDEVKGKYEVTWIIQDKKYVQRVVDTGLLQ